MHVITIATDKNNWLKNWESSAKLWGYEYSILGENVPWEGFSTKIKLIIDFLKKQKPHETVAIVDAYDLIFAGPPGELETKFKSFSSPIVVGGEDVCVLNCHKHTCEVNNPNYRWVNGGCVIGIVEALIDAYTFTLKVSPQDDQIGLAKYMDKYRYMITVDGNQKIVANIRNKSEIKCIKNNRFQHTDTHEIPVIIHTPFMYSDFGARSEMVRKHALLEYESPPFLTYTKGLFSHVYKHVTKNPAYQIPLYCVYLFLGVIILYLLYLIYKKFFKA